MALQKRTSLIFKRLRVVRVYDPKRNALAYLSHSDRIVEGWPKNALSAPPIMLWGESHP